MRPVTLGVGCNGVGGWGLLILSIVSILVLQSKFVYLRTTKVQIVGLAIVKGLPHENDEDKVFTER